MNVIETILNNYVNNVIDGIHWDVGLIIDKIIEELNNGITTSLNKILYIEHNESWHKKIHEIEQLVLQKEIDSLEYNKLYALWAFIQNDKNYLYGNDFEAFDNSLNKIEIFDYLYLNIDFYKNSDYSQDDFFNLLKRQDWLEAEIIKCNIFFNDLEEEILSQINYIENDVILVPDFIDNIEDAQFYYIYGKDINNLSFNTYKRHLLYKLAFLIDLEKINKDFFSNISGAISSFDHFFENSEFYKKLPPIYFAKKIINSEEFEYSLKMISESIISLQKIDSIAPNVSLFTDYDDFKQFIDEVINTTIYDVVHFKSKEFNPVIYNNSDYKYDHDLSRFLQITHILKNKDDRETKFFVYESLKKELEDTSNSIASSIRDYIDNELSEFL